MCVYYMHHIYDILLLSTLFKDIGHLQLAKGRPLLSLQGIPGRDDPDVEAHGLVVIPWPL